MICSLEQKGLTQAEMDFHTKYEIKQSLASGKSFAAVLAGRVNYVGFIKGWDSNVYLSFLRRVQNQNLVLRKGPIEISHQAARSVLYDAIWLIEAGVSKEYVIQQSSGFSWGKLGIVTAAHAVGEYTASGKWTQYAYVQVRCPHLNDGTVFKAKVLRVHPHADLALLEYPTSPLVSFKSTAGNTISPRDSVRILGFPHYRDGDSCTDQDLVVNASRVYSSIHHRVVVGSIITGNSGGPVLDQRNQVVGIALRGQQIPDHFSDKDELSSFAIAETLDLLLQAAAQVSKE
jgi:S1-C subfamily serine protease